MILCHYCGGIAGYATPDQCGMMTYFCARCRMMDADIRATQAKPHIYTSNSTNALPQPPITTANGTNSVTPETLVELPDGETFTAAQVARFIELRAAKGR